MLVRSPDGPGKAYKARCFSLRRYDDGAGLALSSILSRNGRSFLWRWRVATFRERPWTIVALVVLGIVNALAEGLSIGLLIPLATSLFSQSDPFAAMGTLGEFMSAFCPSQPSKKSATGSDLAKNVALGPTGWGKRGAKSIYRIPIPQGLKPSQFSGFIGTTKVVP